MVYVMMGVSGSGKTVVGRELAERLGLPFYDSDEFHPPQNIAKMKANIPLNDADREPWLRALVPGIREWSAAGGAVLACSALKEKHRQILREGGVVKFVFLKGSKELIARRLAQRKNHFMPATLLDSQFAALEIPSDAISVSVEESVDSIVADIVAAVGQLQRPER